MRIAQVSPLSESVPPRLYGGTERIVHYLTETLVAMGHEITLFASGDSRTSARLEPFCEEALRLAGCQDPIAPHLAMAEEVMRRADEFDILHSHIDYLAFPAARRRPDASLVTTMHGRTDLPEYSLIHREFAGMPLISISREQRRFLPDASWLGTVPHGLPADLYPFQGKPGEYLAFLGRISPEKRPDLAIEIARKTGVPLKIAAKIARHEEDYFEEAIKPLLAPPRIEFLGEIGESEKAGFLGEALALLFPVDWPEPFGLVMIEAMACGTPVIAFRRGSVPEVIEEGVSGFIVEDAEAAARAVAKASELDRARVRAAFERSFTTERMAAGYLRLYKRLLASRREPGPQGSHYAGKSDLSRRLFHPGRGFPGREAEPGP